MRLTTSKQPVELTAREPSVLQVGWVMVPSGVVACHFTLLSHPIMNYTP